MSDPRSIEEQLRAEFEKWSRANGANPDSDPMADFAWTIFKAGAEAGAQRENERCAETAEADLLGTPGGLVVWHLRADNGVSTKTAQRIAASIRSRMASQPTPLVSTYQEKLKDQSTKEFTEELQRLAEKHKGCYHIPSILRAAEAWAEARQSKEEQK